MKYSVYIIQSQTNGIFYIGYTSNLNQRIRQHNSGSSKFTKNRGPWKLVHEEEYTSKEEAFRRERQIKKYKGGEAFKRLIDYGEVA